MTIEKIMRKELCVGCGTCAGICPMEAIKMEIDRRGFYIPKVDEKKCTYCGICIKVCPQNNRINNFKELNEFVFEKIPDDKVLGNSIDYYIGHSEDENLRFEASSGGMVTQLLITALEEEIIDGALVTRMRKDDPLIPEPFIARTKEEIISAMGSKYCPVPANIMLKEIIESKDNEKFAVVCLPCHLIGIRKAEKLNQKLRDKIVLHIGIFCASTNSFLGTDFILKQMEIEKKNVRSIKYRGRGWPGYMQIENTEGDIKRLFLQHPLYFGAIYPCFANKNCITCNDHISLLSDISIGDPWRIEEDPKGNSLMISRTSSGEEAIKTAINCSHIKIKKIKRDALLVHPTIKLQKKPSNFFTYTIRKLTLYSYRIFFSNMSITKKIFLFFNILKILINYRLKTYQRKNDT